MRKLLSMFVIWSILAAQGFAARSFNGTTDGFQSGNITLGSAVTISFWLLETTFGSADKLALEESANYNSTVGAFIVDTGGSCGGVNGFYFAQHQSGSNYRERRFTQPSSGVWHHYMLTMTSTSANWDAYVDGVAQTLTNCDSGTPGTQSFASTAICGMSRGCSTTLFNAGRMAQLAIWTVALSANEAASLTSCTEPWQIQAESLALYAPMWGVDSPEPGYASALKLTLSGTTFIEGPPACPVM